MNFGISVGLIVLGAVVSSVITYLITRLRMERMSAERGRAMADAVAALENEKARFDATAKGIEESAKRQALDEFLADLRIEERHYVREHRVLFAHRKSLELQERIFFRNIPLSNWVEHEVPVEEGADLDGVAKTLSVFSNAIEAGNAPSRRPRGMLFRAS
jgi:hypothetical protein